MLGESLPSGFKTEDNLAALGGREVIGCQSGSGLWCVALNEFFRLVQPSGTRNFGDDASNWWGSELYCQRQALAAGPLPKCP